MPKEDYPDTPSRPHGRPKEAAVRITRDRWNRPVTPDGPRDGSSVVLTTTGRSRVLGRTEASNFDLARDGGGGDDLELEDPTALLAKLQPEDLEPIADDLPPVAEVQAHREEVSLATAALLSGSILELCDEQSRSLLDDSAKQRLAERVIVRLKEKNLVPPNCTVAKIYVRFQKRRSVNLATKWSVFSVRVALDRQDSSGTTIETLEHHEITHCPVAPDQLEPLNAMLFREEDPHRVRIEGDFVQLFPINDRDQKRYSLQYALTVLGQRGLHINEAPASDVILNISSHQAILVYGGELHVFQGTFSVCTQEQDWQTFPYLYGFVAPMSDGKA